MKHTYSYFKYFLVLGIVHMLHAQKPYYRFVRMSMVDGLSNNTVRAIHKDKNGFLWIGTNYGLNRYDGYLFKIFQYDRSNENSISSNTVNDIKEDNQGYIWMATENGISRYDPLTNRFKRYLFSKDSNNLDQIIRILVTRSQRIYATFHDGLYFYDAKKDNFMPFIPNKNDPYSIAESGGMDLEEDPEGNIWLTQWPNIISKYVPSENRFYRFKPVEDSLNPLNGAQLHDLTIDKTGNIWFASAGGQNEGLFTLRPKLGLLKKLDVFQGPCYAVAFDNTNNTIWIGSQSEGLFSINLSNMEQKSFMPNLSDLNSISDRFLSVTYIDRENNLWAGTKNFGVNKLKLTKEDLGVAYEVPKAYLGPDLLLTKVIEDKPGNFWLNSNKGLFCFVDKKEPAQAYFNASTETAPLQMCKFRDGVLSSYINGTKYYLNALSPKPIVWNFIGLELNVINAVFTASNGHLWVCADNGVYVYENGDVSKPPLTIKNVKYESITKHVPLEYDFKEYQGAIWINMSQHIYRFSADLSGSRNDIYFPAKNWNIIELNRGPHINTYFIKGDSLYTCSDKYQVVINIKTGVQKMQQIPWIFKREVVPVMIPIDEQAIVYSTYRGIFTYNVVTKKSVKSDIIDIEHCFPNVMCFGTDKKIYFGTNNGIMGFDPFKTDEAAAQTPQLIITDFYLANKYTEPGTPDSPLEVAITNTKKLTLSYKQMIFGFELCLMNYDPERQNGYQYKLEGFDQDWNRIGKRKVATFTNIPAGKYQFLYMAHDKNGNWSKTQKLEIEILPPFWETWWFKFSVVALLAILVWIGVQWRIRALRKQKEELEEMVEIRTSEIQKQKQEISQQNEEIMTQNEEIRQQSEQIMFQLEQIEKQNELISELYQEQTDSILTAQRIQQAILPPAETLKAYFPNHFILYLPKDIVSGDFYWVHQEGNFTYLAAIDCTGHGVAGAFMTLIAHDLLTEIVKERGLNPKEVLDRLNRALIDALHQESENAITKDGMDVAIVRIQKGSQILEFASAQHKMFILRDNELITIDGDKNSVGIQPKGKIAQFELKSLHVLPNDTFYLFSDGYPGQFGGTGGEEKLKYGRFRELIHSSHLKSIQDQGVWLGDMLQKWRKDTPQTDDIMVIGFKL